MGRLQSPRVRGGQYNPESGEGLEPGLPVNVKLRNSVVFTLIVLVVAGLLRHFLPTRYGLVFRSGGAMRGVPLNVVVFWVVLAAAGVTILTKLIVAFARK